MNTMEVDHMTVNNLTNATPAKTTNNNFNNSPTFKIKNVSQIVTPPLYDDDYDDEDCYYDEEDDTTITIKLPRHILTFLYDTTIKLYNNTIKPIVSLIYSVQRMIKAGTKDE